MTRAKKSFKYKGVNYDARETKVLNENNLSSKIWRMNNLYNVIDEDSQMVQFKMRPIQEQFLRDMWYRNIILKSRQHGFSTLIDIWGLDYCLFVPNTRFVIIAHKKDEAAKIMETKAEFPYINMHPTLRERIPLIEHNKLSMKWANGSSIEVATSARSGSYTILHVSEYGYISKHRPDIAEEIKTGSFPAGHHNSFIFVESTAEGTSGHFYDLNKVAVNKKIQRKKLSRMEFKAHFYAWHDKYENRLTDEEAKNVSIPERLAKYFEKLKKENLISLDLNQRTWYVTQEELFMDRIQNEHPSTAEEAFSGSGEGHYFQRQMTKMRKDGRVTLVPHVQGRMVYSFWDLGVNDEMAIWLMQRDGKQWNAIGYLEGTDNGMDFYIDQIRDHAVAEGWVLDPEGWWAPHDIENRSMMKAETVLKQAKDYGVDFQIVKRVDRKITSINATRRLMSTLWIDEEHCKEGIEHLDNYSKQWDKVRGAWKDKPFHDKHSNGADALQTWAMAIAKMKSDGERVAGARVDPTNSRNQVTVDVQKTHDVKLPTAFKRGNNRNRRMKGYT